MRRSEFEILRDILIACKEPRLKNNILRKAVLDNDMFDSFSKDLLECGLLETEILPVSGHGAGGMRIDRQAYRTFFKSTKAGIELIAEVNKLTEMIS